MKTIIFAHPWHGSFNKSILNSVTETLDKKKDEYTVIDLNKDKFNPVMTEEELALYSQGKNIDPLVEKYQEILKRTDELILIFPIWWSSMPAILKGFFDKINGKGFAYEDSKTGIIGLLNNIKTAKIITTAGAPKFIMKILGFGLTMKMAVLGGIGIKKSKWIHFSVKVGNSDEKRKQFLEKVKKFISN